MTFTPDPSVTGTDGRRRGCKLTTAELFHLDLLCVPLRRLAEGVIGGPYLVGSVEDPDADTYRDVDVRLILADDRFDDLFGDKPALWQAFSFAVSRWLAVETGLPIDFQVQRLTEANDRFSEGFRNPLGLGRARQFAGLGDATPYYVEVER